MIGQYRSVRVLRKYFYSFSIFLRITNESPLGHVKEMIVEHIC